MSYLRGKKAAVPASKKRKGASSSSGPTAEVRHPFLRFPIGPQEELFQILQARPLIAGRWIDWAAVEQVQLAEEFKEENDLHALNRHIHRSPSRCWDALVPGGATYNPSRSKASALPPSLRYLHDILAHTIIGWRESTGVMSPQGISSMLSMRMIEKRRGTYPPQYCLAQSTEKEAYEDIPDNVPPQHEDPLTQPPPPSRPVHVGASYADIFERLT
ncbi:hypothetical protein GOBAR_AA09937 [Gossypium barbadense]|uniref:Uncharacterized protein n=1 Tax=Gossypium barbadense TaxID=3634 RepID=A0A2P5Y550_GOSBA|nr:hypothetical protein GOBAR_AA09937 [Gossypium barbadense]